MSSTQNYNDIANPFDEYVTEAITEWTLGYPKLIGMIEPIAGKQILDYGCGAGNFACVLADRGAQVTGVDVSEGMIQIAKNKKTDATFLWYQPGSLNKIPNKSFAVATLNFVLCTIPSANEIISILHEIYESLQSGGLCITMNTNWERCNGKEFASFKLERAEALKSGVPITLYLKSDPPVRLDDYFWSQDDYCGFFREAGFIDVSAKEVIPDTENKHPSWIDEATTSPFYFISGYKP